VKASPFLIKRRRFIEGTAGALAGTAFVGAWAQAAQFEFKCASNLALDHPSSIRLAQMWASVERESGGRIRIQFFPNSALGGDAAMFSQLRVGALEFFLISPGNLASVVTAADIANIGLVYKDADEALRVMDGPLGAYIRQEAASKGVYALRTAWDSGMIQISSSSHPIRVPEDLRNFKIRVVESKIIIDLFKALGASPTPLSFSEVYSALQTKIIDGQAAALVAIEASHFYEVQKYISLTSHAWAGTFLIANAGVWKSLPPDLQGVIERNNTKYAQLERRDTKAANASLAVQLGRQGVQVNQVDQGPFRANLRPYFEYWAAEFGSTEWGLLQRSLGRKLV
jgi:TRAP-type transport system periplasmic protein